MKDNALAEIEWNVKNIELISLFLITKSPFLKEEKDNASWDISLNIGAKKDENTDKISISPKCLWLD